MFIVAHHVIADSDATSSSPSAPPAPLLDQISHETQNLFQSVRPGLVRVQLPVPQWTGPVGDADSPMHKWGPRLSPDVIAKLQEEEKRSASGRTPDLGALMPTSQPTSAPPIGPRFLITRPDGEFEIITGSAQPYDPGMLGVAAPRVLGIVLDEKGHILIPVFVDKEAFGDQPLNVVCSQGKCMAASFVGSDRQTNLTVLQMQTAVGKPLTLSEDRPAGGSLVMLISPDGSSGRLIVWTGGGQQDRGLLISTSGRIGGFVRMGQFLGGDAIRPIADQLIQNGKVRRAALGVYISQAETPTGAPAVRVERVFGNTAASEAGLREGDFILSLAGAPVADVPSFAAAIAQKDGDTDMQVLREGQTSTVTVHLKPQ